MSKYLSRMIRMAVLIIGAVIIYLVLDFCISDDSKVMMRYSLHDFYEEENTAAVFTGSSHTIRMINANLLTEDMGENYFNLAQVDQSALNALYVIKDAYETKHVTNFYYELSPSRFIHRSTEEDTLRRVTSNFTDYSKAVIPRIQQINEVFDSSLYIPAYLRLRRNIDPLDLPSLKDIKSTIKTKLGSAYQNYEAKKYRGLGQWAKNGRIPVLDDGTLAYDLTRGDNITVDRLEPVFINDYKRLMAYCKENDIHLTMFVSPYTWFNKYTFTEYDEVLGIFREEAEKNDMDFWDLNLVKDEYLNLTPYDFFNVDHMSTNAADKVNKFLELCISNPDGDYFYDSIDEKYPKTDEIRAVGYYDYFIKESGEEITSKKQADSEKSIVEERIEVQTFSDYPIPCYARLYEAEIDDEGDEVTYTVGKEIEGTRIDDYTTEFFIPYTKYKAYYFVQLFDPETNEVMYQTVTNFYS